MSIKLMSTQELEGKRVVSAKPSKKDPEATRRIGKVRSCVFHPSEKRFVGVMVKRPDAAMMFHRKDLFVAYNGYDLEDGRLIVHPEGEATDRAACNALDIDLDLCVIWVGMPVMTSNEQAFGLVESVTFDRETGLVETVEVTAGLTSNALLGKLEIPASLIKGFRTGIGNKLTTVDEETEDFIYGAILVDDSVKNLRMEGGLAEKAGEASAIVGNKAHEVHEAANEKVGEAVDAAGNALNKGAYVTGRQLERATHMFSDFKDEFNKASGKGDKALSEADEEVEYVYVDEDGNPISQTETIEYEYVDEDGNVIETVVEEIEYVYVEEEKSAQAKKAEGGADGNDVGRAVGAHLKKAGGMFSAFKDEYKKARH